MNLSANQMRLIARVCLVLGGLLAVACLINFVFMKDDFFLPGEFGFYLPLIVVDFVVGFVLLKMANEEDGGDGGGGFSGGGGFRFGKRRRTY